MNVYDTAEDVTSKNDGDKSCSPSVQIYALNSTESSHKSSDKNSSFLLKREKNVSDEDEEEDGLPQNDDDDDNNFHETPLDIKDELDEIKTEKEEDNGDGEDTENDTEDTQNDNLTAQTVTSSNNNNSLMTEEKSDSSNSNNQYTTPLSNAILPKSGKPMAALNKRLKNSRIKKRKALPIYHSQISDNKIGIKLCIKKSIADIDKITAVPKTKSNRKRSRRPRPRYTSDSEDSQQNKRRRRTVTNNNRKNPDEPVEQTPWGNQMPEEILHKIFTITIDDSGCLPTIVRLGKVCRSWHIVSLSPNLWKKLDLNVYTKDKYRSEGHLKWLIEYRLKSSCEDLHLGNFKITNYECVLERLYEACPNLKNFSVAGWDKLTSDHLAYICESFKRLERLDLSSINVETAINKTAVGLVPLTNCFQTMGERLTHINLSNNRLAGIQQFIACLAKHCPNLITLDLSNVKAFKTSMGIVHIEQLQEGCQKLKVLLITNSQITLNTPTREELANSSGFPDLEELSVASLTDESRLFNDDSLQRILKSSTKLKLLDVRGCMRISHDSLIRLPTWDLKHLFLSGCAITRDSGSGLELIASKWSHSLTEIDLAWANMQRPLDNALKAFAEKGDESPLSHINLCGSSVSLESVKEVLKKCPMISSINLSSCRGLPRGVKRLMQGTNEIIELKENLGVIEKSHPAPAKKSQSKSDELPRNSSQSESADVDPSKTSDTS